ncbi:MAG: DUF3021 domain-containing protein [Oscillospiraceae bacterium]|nr:DUF3021 domain-containing protein [Oscillospiraceae bacterium]
MKRYILEFFRRGLCAWGLGPLVLAVLYLFLPVQTLTAREISLGIFSLSALAFLAGGMNVIYQIERLPLMAAIGIHGGVLYVGYLGTYLLNGWLTRGRLPILVFSGIFTVGYLAIWAVIYAILKRRTARVNALLRQKQQDLE